MIYLILIGIFGAAINASIQISKHGSYTPEPYLLLWLKYWGDYQDVQDKMAKNPAAKQALYDHPGTAWMRRTTWIVRIAFVILFVICNA